MATTRLAYFALFAQQHRGQEGAGLAGCDGRSASVEKDAGLVSAVFTPERLQHLAGSF